MMNLTDIANLRLANQRIAGIQPKTAQQVVAWMGALQAQDYAMAKWAVGVRLAHSTDRAIESAINAGEIIRTHVLRPTWHFVSADDIYWLLALTAPKIKAALKARHLELGLESIVGKSNAVIAKALSNGAHWTRDELIAELGKAKIPTDENRASHLLMRAELEGIVCNGAVRAGKQTLALLEQRVPKKKTLPRDEALATLAARYFSSHGPASLKDFTWWSGLFAGDAKRAFEIVKSNFVSETIGAQTFWLRNSFSVAKTASAVYLLPAYDEFFISYQDRSAILPLENLTNTVSSNGVFHPMIVVNRQIVGLWKRTLKKETVAVELDFFQRPCKTILGLVKDAAARYGNFLEKKTGIKVV